MDEGGSFHQLLNASSEAMIVVDRNGSVTGVNHVAQEFLGWSEVELLGESIGRILPARFHGLFSAGPGEEGSTLLRSANGATVSCFAQRRNGSEFPVELTRRALGPGELGPFLVTLRDLSSWRRGQEARAWSNEMANDTLQSIGDAVIAVDVNGEITFINDAARRLTGWSADQAVGEQLDMVLVFVADYSGRTVENSLKRCLTEGRSIDLEGGVYLRRRDGSEVPVADSTSPILNRNGEIVGVVLVLQDESVRRRPVRWSGSENSAVIPTPLQSFDPTQRHLAR